GHVGRRFVQLLDELGTQLRRDHDLDARVVGIATRSHGCAYEASGLDALTLAAQAENGGSIGRPPPSQMVLRAALRRSASAARAGRLVLVETTTLDITRGQPAIAHVRTALAGGAHVVTANKGPAAFAHRALDAAACRAGRRFLFESAVMDGVPIFNLAR